MAEPHPTCYLNGEFIPLAEARVSVLDRSFLFGDGVYEVIPAYDGDPFLAHAHYGRLANSLRAIEMRCDADFAAIVGQLIERNGGGDIAVYLQVSRGAESTRNHLIPTDIEPAIFAMSQPFPQATGETLENGLTGSLCEDIRWARCDIKSTSLLANVLLREQARKQGADEAILFCDNAITEGASSSVFAVFGGELRTAPNAHSLLPGTTRDFVIALAQELGIAVCEQRIPLDQLPEADEVWISSALREVLPITQIDQITIGEGLPGPVWRQVYARFQAAKRTV